MKNSSSKNQNIVLIAFIISLISMLGSLFFSEFMDFVPCTMCWYQRIFMYPLVFVFLMELLYPDENLFKYSFPLTVIGLVLAIYHNLLMFNVISDEMVPCSLGVPCSTVYINWLGFITIPLLSLTSFSIIFILLLILKKNQDKA